MLKISSFCSGIGSFEQAIKNLSIKHENVFGCEIDKYARQTYLANHECNTMYHDMTKYDYEGEEWCSDINVSGIPCQSFSLAGKRLGELDPRGLLFYDFYRYVKNQQPKYFIIENVKGLLSDNDGNTFQNWINLLGQSVNGDQFMFPHEDSLMYNLHWQVLNTKDYGLPQNRERVFLIGIRNNLPNSFVFPKKIPLELRLKDILEEEVDEKYYLSEKMLEYFNTRADNFNSGKINYKEGGDIASCINASSKSLDISDNILKVNSPTKSGYGSDRLNQTLEKNEVPNEACFIDAYNQTLNTDVTGTILTRIDTSHLYFLKEENGTSNCLTSVQKDNLVIQINPSKESGGVQPYQQNRVYDSEGIAPALCRGKSDLNVVYNNPQVKHNLSGGKWDKMHEQSRRVYDENGIAPTIHTMGGGNQEIKTFDNYRIRKLTPKECFRLQGFSDQFHQKSVDAGVSNSQLYKQCGNSISVPVIQAILKNLLTDYV